MYTKSILLTAISLIISAGLFAQNKLAMKSINKNAPVKCSKTVIIATSPEKVWLILTDINNWANWQTDISNSRLEGNLKANARFDWKSGGVKIHSTLHTVEALKQIGWTGKTFGMFAIHNWTINEKNGNTEVYAEESMEGFFAKLLKNSFNKTLENGMQKWLDLLKQECEK